MKLSRLSLFYKLDQLCLGLRKLIGIERDLVCGDHEGALSTVVSLLIFPQECLQLEVHPWRWHHVDIRDVGVVGLTALLGQVPQEVLRVGIAGSPAHHFLVSPLQQELQHLFWLLAVKTLQLLLEAEILSAGMVGRVGEVEGDLSLYCWVAGAEILDVVES